MNLTKQSCAFINSVPDQLNSHPLLWLKSAKVGVSGSVLALLFPSSPSLLFSSSFITIWISWPLPNDASPLILQHTAARSPDVGRIDLRRLFAVDAILHRMSSRCLHSAHSSVVTFDSRDPNASCNACVARSSHFTRRYPAHGRDWQNANGVDNGWNTCFKHYARVLHHVICDRVLGAFEVAVDSLIPSWWYKSPFVYWTIMQFTFLNLPFIHALLISLLIFILLLVLVGVIGYCWLNIILWFLQEQTGAMRFISLTASSSSSPIAATNHIPLHGIHLQLVGLQLLLGQLSGLLLRLRQCQTDAAYCRRWAPSWPSQDSPCASSVSPQSPRTPYRSLSPSLRHRWHRPCPSAHRLWPWSSDLTLWNNKTKGKTVNTVYCTPGL